MVSEGCPGHGPVHLLAASAPEIGFQWDPLALGWSRPGLPLLSNLAGPVQHFRAAILDAWRAKLASDLCDREGFHHPTCAVHLHSEIQPGPDCGSLFLDVFSCPCRSFAFILGLAVTLPFLPEGPLHDVVGSFQLQNSARVRERDKALLRSVMVGAVWNGFLLGRVRVNLFLVGFVVFLTVMVIFFGMYLSSSR